MGADITCGTGGFFLTDYDHITRNHDLNRDEKKFIKNKCLNPPNFIQFYACPPEYFINRV